jgi:hypothetical protein
MHQFRTRTGRVKVWEFVRDNETVSSRTGRGFLQRASRAGRSSDGLVSTGLSSPRPPVADGSAAGVEIGPPAPPIYVAHAVTATYRANPRSSTSWGMLSATAVHGDAARTCRFTAGSAAPPSTRAVHHSSHGAFKAYWASRAWIGSYLPIRRSSITPSPPFWITLAVTRGGLFKAVSKVVPNWRGAA